MAGTGPVGFVRRDRLQQLRAPDTPFADGPGGLQLRGADFLTRSGSLATLCASLAASGAFALRGEFYPVVKSFGDEPWLQLDRAAVPFFGVRPYGVHLCAFVRKADGLHVWVAVRASDQTFPGRWDNTVAGGQPIDLSVRDNLAKECAEEAGIPARLAERAVATSTLTYVREDEAGLRPDTLFCFDLELPPDFEPEPHDGEVERFLLLPIAEVLPVVRDTARCKPNCALVWIDFLLRHGALDGELSQPQRNDLGNRLHAPLP